MKRILHFADVHFHQTTLEDLREPLNAILDYARDLRDSEGGLDAIVIAGDLTTDRGIIDNSTAVAARSFVNRLAKWAPVYILAGNHDLTFKADQPNNLRAILADDRGEILAKVRIVDRPEIIERDGYSLAFLPYPSPATFHAATGESDNGLLSARLVDVVRGLAVKAAERPGARLAAFHGTVEGGRSGDEASPALVTRGREILVPPISLAGFRGVLCGHLHHPQTLQIPDGLAVYPGCVAPLTFGERTIEPGVLVWSIDEGEVKSIDRLPLPVAHQRIQLEIGAAEWLEDRDATGNLREWVAGLPPSARVKVKLTLGRQRLNLFTNEIVESVRQSMEFRDLRIDKTEIPEGRQWFDQSADRAARVDVVEALEVYAETTDDPAWKTARETVLAIAREVEEQVGAQGEDPRYEFEPLTLELTNYKQFADAVIDFTDLPERVGILGPTGSGKSNLVLALAAALFGGNPKSEIGKAKTSIGEMVRRGERSAKIRLVFQSNGQTYRITREITVDSKGRGSAKLFFETGEPSVDLWTPMNEGTARDTQPQIEALVGPPELHWITRHLRQHGQSAVKMSSSELADAINGTLQLDFDARLSHGKQILQAAESAKQACANRIAALQGNLPPDSLLDEQERRATDQLTSAQVAGLATQEKVSQAEVVVDEHTNRLAGLRARLDQVSSSIGERAKLQADLQDAQSKREQADRTLRQHAGTPDLVELEATAAQARAVADEAARRESEVVRANSQEALEEAGALGGLAASSQAAALRRTEAHARLQAARRRVDELGKSAALVSEVPCRGERWTDLDEGEMDGTRCPLLANARAAALDLPAAVDSANQAKSAYDGAQADFDVAYQAHEQAKHSAELRRAEALAQENAARTTARQARELAEKAANELARHRAAAQAVESIRQQIPQLDTRLADVQARLHAVESAAQQAGELAAQVSGAERELASAKSALAGLRADLQRHRETVVRAESDLAHVQAQRQAREQTLATISQLQDEQARQERRRLAAAFYCEAVTRTGIPSLLLDQLAPQLEHRINDMLEPTGRQMKIETTRELTSGKTKTEVNLSFRSPASGDAYVPIAELSGGEEDLANLVFAAGLARVSADMTGVPLSTLYLDEPLVGVSESMETEALEVMGRIGRHAKKVVVITHRRDLASGMDQVIEVSANGAGSIVEVQS